MRVLLLFLLLVGKSGARTVFESNLKRYPLDIPCKVWHYDFHPAISYANADNSTEEQYPGFRQFAQSYTQPIQKGSNCSIHFHFLSGPMGEFKGLHGNGTPVYDGLINDLMEHKYDFAVMFARTDSLPHEPVIHGPVVSAADNGILSGTHRAKQETLPFMSFIANFDVVTYAFILFSVYMVVTMCVLMTVYAPDRTIDTCLAASSPRIWSRFFGYGFKCFCCLIDQSLFDPDRMCYD